MLSRKAATPLFILMGIVTLGFHKCCDIEPPESVPAPPDEAKIVLWQTPEKLAEANDVAASYGFRSDAVCYFDAGESGNKRLFLRDCGITDPNTKVSMQCMGVDLWGNADTGPGVISNLRNEPTMVDQDGTPIVTFDFTGMFHEVCAIYVG